MTTTLTLFDFDDDALPQQEKPRREVPPLQGKDFRPRENDGVPRIVDWRLAQVLGFEAEREIRQLIKRHELRLEGFGTLWHRATKSTGGRPAIEYRLNFEQAIFIIVKSDASNADPVTQHVIEIYGKWARGELVPTDEAAAVNLSDVTAGAVVAAPEIMASVVGIRDPLAEMPPELATLASRVAAADKNARRRQFRHDRGIEKKLEALRALLEQLAVVPGQIEQVLELLRRDPPPEAPAPVTPPPSPPPPAAAAMRPMRKLLMPGEPTPRRVTFPDEP